MKGNCAECCRRWVCEIDPSDCNEWPDPVPVTNADRIRAMSDEELASVIMCPYQFDGELDCKEHNCFQCSLKWLQQPAEGE